MLVKKKESQSFNDVQKVGDTVLQMISISKAIQGTQNLDFKSLSNFINFWDICVNDLSNKC